MPGPHLANLKADVGASQGNSLRQKVDPGPQARRLKANAFKALLPRFKKQGVTYKRPLYSGGDASLAKRPLQRLTRLTRSRLDLKAAKLKSLNKTIFNRGTYKAAANDVKTLTAMHAAAKTFAGSLESYHRLRLEHETLRQTPIPPGDFERGMFMDKLEQNSRDLLASLHDVKMSGQTLRHAADRRRAFVETQTKSMYDPMHRAVNAVNRLADEALASLYTGDIDAEDKQVEPKLKKLRDEREDAWLDVNDIVQDAIAENVLPASVKARLGKEKVNGPVLHRALAQAEKTGADRKQVARYRTRLSNPVHRGDIATKALRTEPNTKLGRMEASLKDEYSRVLDLSKQIGKVREAGGEEALKEILGDPRKGQMVRTGDALQALRNGEPISPYLKDVFDGRKVIKTEPKVHGKGVSNTVYSAKLALPGRAGPPEPYILKPLSGQVRPPGSHGDVRLPAFQTRAFSRQLAAHKLSERLKLGLVAEPKLVGHNGQLHMAMPEVKGKSAISWVNGLHRRLSGRAASDTLKALHHNRNLQMKMKDVQLFHALTGNVDGHGNNLKIRFLDKSTGKAIEPQDLARMGKNREFDRIRELDVEVGLFDMDGAFTGSKDALAKTPQRLDVPNRVTGNPKAPPSRRLTLPGAAHNVGAPPFHTAEDREKVKTLVADLGEGGAVRQGLAFCLTGKEEDNEGVKSQELDAMQSRASQILQTMERQAKTGQRADKDSTGQDLDKMVDKADTVATYKNSKWRYVARKAAVIEKYFPVRNVYR